jgi:hypothetical protein
LTGGVSILSAAMIHRIVPFLFFALAIQQAASLCVCRADESFIDPNITEHCSQLSDAEHEEIILDVVSDDEPPCISHQPIASVKRHGTSTDGISAPQTHHAVSLFGDSHARLTTAPVPDSPESVVPAVNLPLLN